VQNPISPGARPHCVTTRISSRSFVTCHMEDKKIILGVCRRKPLLIASSAGLVAFPAKSPGRIQPSAKEGGLAMQPRFNCAHKGQLSPTALEVQRISVAMFSPCSYSQPHTILDRLDFQKVQLTMPTWQESTRQTRAGSHIHGAHLHLSQSNKRKM
jgi:hypothetical protein